MLETPPDSYNGSTIEGLWRNIPQINYDLGAWLIVWNLAGWSSVNSRLGMNGIIHTFIRNR